MLKKEKKVILISLVSSFLLAACSNSSDSLSNGNGSKKVTTAEILRGIGGNTDEFRKNIKRNTNPDFVTTTKSNSDYTRSESKELKGLFPRLPNPDICMYVFPHLSAENATIPGYTSCFSMYEKNHYALPGEVSTLWQVN